MWAEWDHAYMLLPVNLVQCRLKEGVFHLMLQNNVATNIGQNCQTISGLYFWVQGAMQPAVSSEC